MQTKKQQSNVVKQGDCLVELEKLEDKSVDLILIDPPYNIGKDEWDDFGITKKGYQPKPYTGESYYDWMQEVFVALSRVMKDSGSFWFFHNDFRMMAELDRRIQSTTDFEYKNFIVWNKLFPGCKQEGFLNGFVQVEGLNNFQKMAEYMLFYTRKDIHLKLKERRMELGVKSSDISKEILSKTGGLTGWYSNIETGKNYPTEETIIPITKYLGFTMNDLVPKFYNQKNSHSIWQYDFDSKKMGHLTPKPIELLKNIIVHCTDPGDLVLDCFGGSGSTAVACIETDRNYLLIEKEQKYVEIAEDRIARYSARLPI
ncbi:MAG: site-specific DNA-methyltransferase [Proteobacteria bacterium]|jgi:site-specific DNA-methyltransferase (adenine-specific)|nr:site-specific DNA-methyltransferase [Pseudomonadota bacterium]